METNYGTIQRATTVAAEVCRLDDKLGSIEAGKMADVVIWSGNPFSVYAKADHVYIDGALVYDRENPELQPVSDFELGQLQGVSK